MSATRPRLAWIGCGRQARGLLLPALAGLPVELVALCNRGRENLELAAALTGVRRLFTDWRDMLDQGGFDAVGLAVGPAAHAEMAREALGRGWPVFMEKPPGANLADARAILAASRKAGKPAAIGFHKRFSAGNRIARNVIRQGGFGRLAGLLGQYMTSPAYFGGDASYDSFFLHHCVHCCDLLLWLAGPLSRLEARGLELEAGKLLLHVDLEFASGAVGSLIMGTIQSRGNPVEFLQLMGDHRRLEVDNVQRVRYYRDPALKVGDPAAGLDEKEDALVWEPNYTIAAGEDVKGYRAMLADFLELLADRPAAIAQAADGAAAMAMLDALRRSWSERKAVSICEEMQ
jgi:myo-inositol 2-dehydrogenase / D-chiro-inositol 1-dehydrogenase